MGEHFPMNSGERLIRAFELTQVEAVFSDPQRRREYYDALDFPTYDYQAQWAMNVYLKPPVKERESVPNNMNMLITEGDDDPNIDIARLTNDKIVYVAPRPPLAKVLMREVFEASKTIENTEAAATLLRLGSFLTHRRFDANTRGAAMEYSLLTRGFDGSEADKQYYAKLTEGRDGLRELGIDIETAGLTRTFTDYYMRHQARRHGYSGDLPQDLLEFNISELGDQRPDLQAQQCRYITLRLAERYSGLALATSFGLRAGDLESYLVYPANEPAMFNTLALFATVDDRELLQISRLHDDMKAAFIRSITNCFLGDQTIYGSRDQLMAQLSEQ